MNNETWTLCFSKYQIFQPPTKLSDEHVLHQRLSKSYIQTWCLRFKVELRYAYLKKVKMMPAWSNEEARKKL